jgi:hypothetical protein
LSRNDYFYALHHNPDGRETAARKFGSKEAALAALANEAGERLTFVDSGARSSSHTLKRFANTANRPAELLETFLATTADWAATIGDWAATERPPPPTVVTEKIKRKRPE